MPSRAEQETTVRFDRAAAAAVFWTSDRFQATRWAARGYPIVAESGGWRAEVPKRAITFRTLSAVLATGAGPEDGPELADDLDDDEALARMMAEEEAGS